MSINNSTCTLVKSERSALRVNRDTGYLGFCNFLMALILRIWLPPKHSHYHCQYPHLLNDAESVPAKKEKKGRGVPWFQHHPLSELNPTSTKHTLVTKNHETCSPTLNTWKKCQTSLHWIIEYQSIHGVEFELQRFLDARIYSCILLVATAPCQGSTL